LFHGVRFETSPAQTAPPSFLNLAGHPVRWRLLNDLANSDRRVGELCARLELPQNLVSYHLGRLRAEGMVSRRRSAADGRDSYYVLELERCGELLSGAGSALHPGLRLAPTSPDWTGLAARRHRARVLFLCTGNSARSQIAEALTEHLGGGVIEAQSAGSHPKPLHPNAVRALRERGIDIAGRRSKHLDEFSSRRFDYVVSLCDRVREVCPEFPGHPDLIHWSIPDPGREPGGDSQTYPAFERIVEELSRRIAFLLELINTQATPTGVDDSSVHPIELFEPAGK
jgi:ArsR family transcriptional regulator, arsenate/arsenite/antimonite-responsive transcriptional repressor / arsenate reductase (thioredoxin)